MFSQVTATLRARADQLMAGRLQDVVQGYTYPLPLHMGAHRIVVRTPDEALAMLGLLRTALIDRGVVQLRPTVTAIDLPRAGRFRVWADWHELAIPVDGTRMSSAVYYCRNTGSGLRTEMVAYTRLSMPELNPQFAALALSA